MKSLVKICLSILFPRKSKSKIALLKVNAFGLREVKILPLHDTEIEPNQSITYIDSHDQKLANHAITFSVFIYGSGWQQPDCNIAEFPLNAPALFLHYAPPKQLAQRVPEIA